MTTIVDPAGTPIIVFNASGTAIIVLNSTNTGDPVEIPALSGHVVVLATTIYSPSVGYKLSPDFKVGDIVEIYPAFPTNNTSGTPTSSPIYDEDDNLMTPGIDFGVLLRKIPSGLVKVIYNEAASTGNWVIRMSYTY